MQKPKIKILIIVLSLILILTGIFVVSNRIKNNDKNEKKAEEEEEFSYFIYKTYDDEIQEYVALIINSQNGLEYVECPDGKKITANGRKKLSLDYIVEKGKDEYYFKIKEIGKDEKTERVYIDDTFISDTSIEIDMKTNVPGYKQFEILNKEQLKNKGYNKLYYRIGKNGTWTEYSSKVTFLDYHIMLENLQNEDGTVTISAKSYNTANKNGVIVDSNYVIDTSNEDNTVASESLLKAIEDYNYGSGLASVTVEDQTYDLRVYEINSSIIIDSNMSFGIADDIGTASEYAKRTVVIKVNGDLTINSGGNVNSYRSNYGGTKGLMIYCTGTLTNNSTITMTARGARAEGQDIYLWKNADGTYETVPKVGGAGGAKVSGVNKSGNKGDNANKRMTGGGGSGSTGYGGSVSGAGAAGTSYSGGTGGGGGDGKTGGNGASNGRAGGNGISDAGAGMVWGAGGGAGNPGGSHQQNGTNGGNGTGGLLIIYAQVINNTGTIVSNGSNGGAGDDATGGGSGGGSINMFYKDSYNNSGTITANGGTRRNSIRSCI